MIQVIIAAHDLYKVFGHPIQIFFQAFLKPLGQKILKSQK